MSDRQQLDAMRQLVAFWQSELFNNLFADRDALARDLADAVVHLNRASGALIDAGTVSTENVEAGIRALAREMEEWKRKAEHLYDIFLHSEDAIAYEQLERQLAEARQRIAELEAIGPAQASVDSHTQVAGAGGQVMHCVDCGHTPHLSDGSVGGDVAHFITTGDPSRMWIRCGRCQSKLMLIMALQRQAAARGQGMP